MLKQSRCACCLVDLFLLFLPYVSLHVDSIYHLSLIQPLSYPCLCLCLGSLQITLTTRFLLIILQFLHSFFTEALTFIAFLHQFLLGLLFSSFPRTVVITSVIELGPLNPSRQPLQSIKMFPQNKMER